MAIWQSLMTSFSFDISGLLEGENQGRRQDRQLWQGRVFGPREEQSGVDLVGSFLQEVLEVLDQEVLEEEQLEGLVACRGLCEGLLRVEILPDQQRRR